MDNNHGAEHKIHPSRRVGSVAGGVIACRRGARNRATCRSIALEKSHSMLWGRPPLKEEAAPVGVARARPSDYHILRPPLPPPPQASPARDCQSCSMQGPLPPHPRAGPPAVAYLPPLGSPPPPKLCVSLDQWAGPPPPPAWPSPPPRLCRRARGRGGGRHRRRGVCPHAPFTLLPSPTGWLRPPPPQCVSR